MASRKQIKTPNGKPMLPARKVAERLHCAPDYVGKLCREGKLRGRLVDQAWYVDASSVAEFETARKAARLARSQELSAERRQELANASGAIQNELPIAPTPRVARVSVPVASVSTTEAAEPLASTHTRATARVARVVPLSIAALVPKVVAACVAAGLLVAGSSMLTSTVAGPAHGNEAAALATVQSPFFGAQASAPSAFSFGGWLASLFAQKQSAQPLAQVAGKPSAFPETVATTSAPIAANHPATKASGSTPTTVNTYPVTERVVEKLVSGAVSEDELAQKLQELTNSLTSQIYAISSQTAGNQIIQYAPAQRIDNLSGTKISGATITSSSISGYVAAGDAIRSTSAATSTFANGIALTGGCFSVNGTCISPGASDLSAATGVLAVVHGGTGTSTAPSYGQLLVGNASGGYDLLATSSLGITGGSFSTTSAIYFVNASSTIAKTYTANTFTAAQTFSTFTATSGTTTNATSTNFFATTASSTNLFAQQASLGSTTLSSLSVNGISTTTGLVVTGSGFTLSSFGNCTLKTDASGTVTCGTDLQGSGSANDWVYFNGSGERLATTTNQLLLGASATTSVAQLEVIAQGTKPAAYFSGNVGIGTTSPYAMLAVAGQVVANYFTATSTATSTFAGGLQALALNVTSSSASSTFANGINLTAGCFSINGSCVTGGGSSSLAGLSDVTLTSPVFGNLLEYNGTKWVNVSTSSLGITGGGGFSGGILTAANVIGTSTATSTFVGGINVATGAGCLAVNGSCISTGSLTNYWTLSGGNLYNNSGTNVGIGNSSPSYPLDVTGAINSTVGYKVAGATVLTASAVNFSTLVGSGAGVSLTSSGLHATAVGYQALNAATNASDLTAVGYQALASNITGNSDTAVGSGALTANVSGAQNTAVGAQALASNVTGSQNAAFGYNALTANTTGARNSAFGTLALSGNLAANDNTGVGYNALGADISGAQNAALGSGALAANTSGAGNTAFGYQALTANTSGTQNVAEGYQALSGNTTGSYNVALGPGALAANNGDENVGIGHNALSSNSNGTQNLALGGSALAANTTGFQNIALGYNALASSVTGTQNAALGFGALRFNGAATSTVAIGYQAGYGTSGQTVSQNNVFVGFQAGLANTTGGNNTLLGYKAGSNLTTGSGNIVVGYNLSAPSATGNNQLTIGNLLYGTNVDGTGSTYSTGQLGVGSSTPFARFSIHANNGDTNTMLFAIGSSTANSTTTLFSIDNKGLATFTNVLLTGSTTLTNLTFINATGTNATTTNFYSTTASSSNLYSSFLAVEGNALYVSNNKVGIGTTSPATTFVVDGTDAIKIPVGTSVQRPGTNQVGQVRYNTTTHQFEGYGDSGVWQGLGGVIDVSGDTYIIAESSPGADDNTLHFYTAGVQRAVIGPTGNLGVGTTSPYARLAVSGFTTGTPGIVADALSGFTGNLFELKLASSTKLSVNQNGDFLTLGSTTLQNFTGQNATTTNATSTNFFATTASSTNFFSTNFNLGVGTVGNATTTNLFSTTASSTNLFAQNGTIGTLTVGGNASVTGTLTQIGASSFTGLASFLNASTSLLSVFTKSYFGGTATTTIDSSGNIVGAGTLNLSGLGTLQSGYVAQASSTVVGNFTTTGTNAFGGALNVTGLTSLSGNASTTQLSVTSNSYLGTAIGSKTLIGTSTANAWNAKLGISANGSLSGTVPLLSVSADNTNQLFSVQANGFTGIGLATANYLFDVANTNNNSQIHLSGSAADSGGYLTSNAASGLTLTGGASFDGTFWNAKTASSSQIDLTNGAINFYANTGLTNGSPFTRSQRATITSGGFLGVGTTSPASMLSVGGDAFIGGNSIITGTATTTNLYVSSNVTGAGLSTCADAGSKLLWANGTFSCGADAGSGANQNNWVFFNGSGVRTGTTTNAVLVGASATTTNGIVEVAGGNLMQTATNPVIAAASAGADLAYQTAVSGNYAYLAENANGLRIVDIRNPSSPTTVGRYSAITTALSVAVAGHFAYVGDTGTGLNVIDVSNPSNPVKVGNYSFPGLTFSVAANSLVVSGRYVYMTDYNNPALRILDVSNPASPRLVGSFAIAGGAPYSLAVRGKYAYVGDQGTGKIVVVDISDPANPAQVGTVGTGLVPMGLYVSGRYLYEADNTKGFIVYNISNPAAPVQLGQYKPDATDSYYGLSVAGDYAYVADNGHAKTLVLNISNPASPVLAGSYTVASGNPMSVALSGKYAYVADYTGGLQAIDITGTKVPALTAGAIGGDQLNIADNGVFGGDISAGGGIDVGISGIFSRGTIAAYIASSTAANPTVASFIGGNVGIGTSSPYARLSIAANSTDANIQTTLFAIASSTGSFATTTLFSVSNAGLTTVQNFIALASTTLQNFTGLNATTSNATSTNLFATTASSTNLFSTNFNLGVGTLGNATSTNFFSTVASSTNLFSQFASFGTTSQNSLPLSVGSFGGNSAYFAGNVGIGTSSPTYPLTLDGNLNGVERAYIRNQSSGSSAFSSLTFGNDASAILGGFFANSSTNAAYGGGSSLNLINSSSNGSLSLGTNNAVQLLITSAGNVGLGTTTPNNLLTVGTVGPHVNTTLKIVGQNFIGAATGDTVTWLGSGVAGRGELQAWDYNASAALPLAINDLGGNVGIGTSTPLRTLQVLGTAGIGSTPTGAGVALQTNGSVGEILGINPANTSFNALQFRTGTSPALYIDTSSNVGLGSTTPYARLAVSGFTTGTPGIVADALSGFTGNLFELKLASSTKLSVNQNGDFLTLGSTTLQNFTGLNATTSQATTTNLFATTASSTNLFAQAATLGTLTVSGNTTHTGTLAQTGLATFTSGFLSQASSTVAGNFTTTGTNAFTGATNFTGLTTHASGFVSQASSTVVGNFTTTGTNTFTGATNFTGLTTHAAGFVSQASSTVVGNFTTTGTNAFTGATNFTGLTTHAAGFVSQASSTVVGNFTTTGTNAFIGATNFTGLTTHASGFVSQASSTVVGNFTTTGTLSVGGLSTLTSGFVSQASSTVVGNFTTTGTNAFIGATNFTGLTTHASGFVSQASSTVVGNFTTTGTNAFTGTTNFTGLSSFQNASTSLLSVFTKAYFGGTATSTFDSAGNFVGAGTLNLSGLGTLTSGFVSQASSTVVGNFTTTGTNAFTGATNFTGLTTHAAGFVSQASSTVVGNFTTTGTNAFGGVLNLTGLGTLASGFVSQASSTVVGAFTNTGNHTIGGNLSVTGTTLLSSALTYGGVTLNNAVTGTGNMVLSVSPTLTGTPVLPSTFTVGANSFIRSGANDLTLTTTGTTNVTLPTSGTLYGTAANSITSAQLATSLSDETGSGAAVFGTSPTISSPSISGGTFSGLQSFANASTSLLSVFAKAYFGGTATSTFDSAGNLAVAGTANLSGALTYGGVTLANAVTGTGNMVLSASPTFTGIAAFSNLSATAATSTSLFGGAITGNTASFGATATSSFNSAGALTLASALTVGNGGTGQTSFTSGNLLYGAGTGAVQNVATTSATIGSSLSYSGTFGALVGGASGTLSLNMANANIWTGLQSFANASTSLLSVFQKAYFGGTATSTFDSAGNLALVGNGLTVGTNQLVTTGGFVGIGTTTPWAKLAVNPVAGDTNQFVVGSSTNTSFLITPNGNIGIASTSANHTLDVNGNIGLGINSYINWGNADGVAGYGFRISSNHLQFNDPSSGGWSTLGSGSQWSNVGAGIYFVNNGGGSYGPVGIGTTTPGGAALQIASSTGPQLLLTDSGAGANLKHIFASSTAGSLVWGSLADNLITKTPVMALDTVNKELKPDATLDAAFKLGTTSARINEINLAGAAASSGINFWQTTGTNFEKGSLGFVTNSVTGNPTLTLQTTQGGSGQNRDIYLKPAGSGSGLYVGGSGQVGIGYQQFDNSIGNALLINGRLGIGTTSPQSKFDVSVNGRNTGDQKYGLRVVNSDSGSQSTGMEFVGSGAAGSTWIVGTDVGASNVANFFIATTTAGATNNPSSAIFQITTDGAINLANTSNVVSGNKLYAQSGGLYWDGTQLNGAGITNYWAQNGTTNYPANFGNSVGIGTTTAGARLAVAGSAGSATPLFMLSTTTSGNATSTAAYFSNNGNLHLLNGTGLAVGYTTTPPGSGAIFSGNVGIGTTSPASLFSVAGNGYFTGNLGIGKVAGASNQLDVTSAGSTTVAFSSGSTGAFRLNMTANSNIVTLGVEGTTPGSIIASGLANAGVINVISANALQLGTNNTARMTIDSSGNVGIGTTSPTAALHIRSTGTPALIIDTPTGTDNTLRFAHDSTSAMAIYSPANTSDLRIFDYNGTADRVTFKSGGNVGIGTTTPLTKLDIIGGSAASAASSGTTPNGFFKLRSSNVNAALEMGVDTAGSGWLQVHDVTSQATNYNLLLEPNGGAVLINTIVRQNAANLTINLAGGTSNGIAANDTAAVSGASFNTFLSNGTLIGSITNNANTATAFNTTSDRRIKENIASSTLGLSTLVQIPVRNFDFKSDPNHATTQGFIAQELQPLYPYAVTTNGDNGTDALTASSTPWQVDYGRLTPLIVKSIQDLNSKFDTYIASGTATTTNLVTVNATTTNTDTLCLGGDCRSAWPTASTSSVDLSGYAKLSDFTAFASTTNAALAQSASAADLASTTNALYSMQNEIAALSGGNSTFHASASSTSDAGLGTPIIANWAFSSSTPGALVDYLKPVAGIEPATRGIPSPASDQLTGYLALYHNVSAPSLIATSSVWTPNLAVTGQANIRSLALGTGGLTFTDGSFLGSAAGLVSTTSLVQTLAATLANYASSTTDFAHFASNIVPNADNAYTLGTPQKRFTNIYAQNINAGDLTFTETANPVGYPAHTFVTGDVVSLFVNSTSGSTHTVPMDLLTAINTGINSSNALFLNTTGGLGVGISSSTGTLPAQLTVRLASTTGGVLTSYSNTSATGNLSYQGYISSGGDYTFGANDAANGTRITNARPVWNVTLGGVSDLFDISRAASGSGAFSTTSALRINNSGYVGIGTTSPQSQLSVSTLAQQSGTLPLFSVASTTNASLFTVLGNGNVGIGTSSPMAALALNAGQFAAPAGSAGAPSYAFTNDLASGIWSPAASALAFSTAGSERLRITSAGLVGVGTTTPFAKFAINPVAGDTNQFVVGSSTATSFIINNSGNVGIGTTTPESLLSLNSAGGGFNSAYNFGYSGGSPQLKNTITLTGAGAGPRKDLSAIMMGVGSSDSSNYQGYLTFSTTPSAGSLTERVRIDSSGNVGIGTTSPTTLLHVGGAAGSGTSDIYGTFGPGSASTYDGLNIGYGGATFGAGQSFINAHAATAANARLKLQTNGTTALTIDNNQSVGIGTTTPNNLLSLYSGSKSALEFSGGAGRGAFTTGFDVTNNRFSIASSTALGTTDRFTISPLGEFGINTVGGGTVALDVRPPTNTTASILQLAGAGIDTLQFSANTAGNSIIKNVSNSALLFGTNNTTRMTIDQTGNVGIGTASPANKFAVVSDGASGDYQAYAGLRVDDVSTQGSDVTFLAGVNSTGHYGWIQTLQPRLSYTNRPLILQPNGGNVGMGGTAANTALQVTGDVRVGTSGTNGCVQNFAGTALTGTCSSDQRLKTVDNNVTGVLDKFSKLQLVNFHWNQTAADIYHNSTTTQNTGFIAQAVQQQFPELVITDSHGYEQLDYTTLGLYGLEGIKELNAKVDANAASAVQISNGTISLSQPATTTIAAVDGAWSLATSTATGTMPIIAVSAATTTSVSINAMHVYINGQEVSAAVGDQLLGMGTSTNGMNGNNGGNGTNGTKGAALSPVTAASSTYSYTPADSSYAAKFVAGLKSVLAAWFADAGNGIADLFAAHIHAQVIDAQTVNTQTLCVGGTCITEAQLKAMLNGQAASSTSSTSTTTSAVAPQLSVNGANPATVAVGAAYSDLGATITGPSNDLNLGVWASVDAAAAVPQSQIAINTSLDATHQIVYSATDQAGVEGFATRTVIVGNGGNGTNGTNGTKGAASSASAASSTPTTTSSTTSSTSTTTTTSASTASASTTTASSTPTTTTSTPTTTSTTTTASSTPPASASASPTPSTSGASSATSTPSVTSPSTSATSTQP